MSTYPPRGYTLVELIVSVAIFSIVMLVATSAFLTLIEMDRKARATNDVVTNLSYVVDSMERSVRTGNTFSCNGVGDCVSGGTSFSFIDYEGQEIEYLLKPDGTIGQCTGSPCTSSSATSLTDPRIVVDALTFYTVGTVRGNAVQPRVTFTISGYVQPRPQDDPIRFSIQAGATQRLIDL